MHIVRRAGTCFRTALRPCSLACYQEYRLMQRVWEGFAKRQTLPVGGNFRAAHETGAPWNEYMRPDSGKGSKG